MDREQSKKQQELDQATASVADFLPSYWRRLYVNLLDSGFNSAESMVLVQFYILSQGNAPIHIKKD